ncbi:hypothetical protein CEXT_262351 [Caerostris extrusa]|uniref:Uncharacterized protein n=1 Tax=Caerostris extrusa TaxID=172846 RepID=A0AAV4QMF3_CAEEX|nr:hypothetical protein CEXT_262351 [Caerostris extrusa]
MIKFNKSYINSFLTARCPSELDICQEKHCCFDYSCASNNLHKIAKVCGTSLPGHRKEIGFPVFRPDGWTSVNIMCLSPCASQQHILQDVIGPWF